MPDNKDTCLDRALKNVFISESLDFSEVISLLQNGNEDDKKIHPLLHLDSFENNWVKFAKNSELRANPDLKNLFELMEALINIELLESDRSDFADVKLIPAHLKCVNNLLEEKQLVADFARRSSDNSRKSANDRKHLTSDAASSMRFFRCGPLGGVVIVDRNKQKCFTV